MKITPALLESLGFEKLSNHHGIEINQWNLTVGGYLFNIRGGPDRWEFYPPGAYVPYSHSVTDLEELLPFTFRDGMTCGKEAMKKEFRELIGVKNGD